MNANVNTISIFGASTKENFSTARAPDNLSGGAGVHRSYLF